MTPITTDKRIRWGILGTASIARRQAAPAIQLLPKGTLTAIASRNAPKAQQFADEFNVPHAFDAYEKLLTCNDVDVVYIPLPNDMHTPWILKALEHGKHVLCEKPIGLHAQEVRTIARAAADARLQVMEGIPTYFHPLHARAQQLVKEGAVGQPMFVRVSLGWSFRDQPDDYRWRQAQGGGALLDLGGYAVSTARLLIGEEPTAVSARATVAQDEAGPWFHPSTDADDNPPNLSPHAITEDGVDTNVAITMMFPTATAQVNIGIMTAARNEYEVIGTDGRLVAEQAFGNRVAARTLKQYDFRGQLVAEHPFKANQMALQFQAVTEALYDNKPLPISLEESLNNIQIIDSCFASARIGGQFINVPGNPT